MDIESPQWILKINQLNMKETTSKQRKSGTKEWSDKSINFIKGCGGDSFINYYMKCMEIRFKGIKPKKKIKPFPNGDIQRHRIPSMDSKN